MRTTFSAACQLFLLLAACAGAGPKEGKGPVSIKRTNYVNGVMSLDVAFEGATRSGQLIERSGDVVLATARAIGSGRSLPSDLQWISFTFIGPPRGDPVVKGKFAHLSYKVERLEQAIRNRATSNAVLGMADDGGTWTPTNTDITNDYCGLPQRSVEFCSRFAG